MNAASLTQTLAVIAFLTFAFGGILLGPFVVVASAPGRSEGPVLVISNWGEDAEAIVAEQGGEIIGPRRAMFGVFASSDDRGFSARLRQQGAWAVIDGALIAALCRTNS
ncbi:hypothetical protein [Maritimibacter sp. UBA3975]|uniref:hypothetical protein n=1 Tax=Maritimibacter sp. UBA3975 TaxID=1946833 RepID=UPI000C092F68|nr:hypothetical protein [Maritimibacter sp. UBA3975]MAM60228.1 hypothetical protein [Maritimibacter sp.]|tara:strand:+ start:11200 stop:11526 length:327 start_codon:yes stop_codon:yes gene_type:complete